MPGFISSRSADVTRRLLATLLTVAVVAGPGCARAVRPADAAVYLVNDQATDVKALLAAGWDPNTRIKGQPVIMQAVRDGAWRVFDVLAADPRTDLNAANATDETPLMYLAVQGQTARARTLIARGAQVNRLGWTPLHYAASRGHLDTARLLLSHQAIVNAPGPDGTTPLMMAGLAGSRDMVQLLIDAGADPTMRNLSGLSAADWARSAKHENLADALAKLAAARPGQTAARPGSSGAGTPAPAPAGAGDGSARERAPRATPAHAREAADGEGGDAGARAGADAGADPNAVGGVKGLRTDPDGANPSP